MWRILHIITISPEPQNKNGATESKAPRRSKQLQKGKHYALLLCIAANSLFIIIVLAFFLTSRASLRSLFILFLLLQMHCIKCLYWRLKNKNDNDDGE